MAWKTEVIADSSGTWAGNALVFETKLEALAYAKDLMGRWLAVRDYRMVYTDEKVNYVIAEGALTRLEEVPR